MNKQALKNLLQSVRDGTLNPEMALERLATLPYENLESVRLDHHRELRTGLPEVIWGDGKTAEQIVTIMDLMRQASHDILVTRLSDEKAQSLLKQFPLAQYSSEGRILSWRLNAHPTPAPKKGTLAILTAGTSDIPVAEEACVTAQFLGHEIKRIYDVGVAGLHRLLDKIDEVREASVVIAVAGMEGALPSVVAGLVDKPVIAVPTSVGYGTSLSGLTALFAMLNSCAAGVTVVNIDNGFGAAVAAHKMVSR